MRFFRPRSAAVACAVLFSLILASCTEEVAPAGDDDFPVSDLDALMLDSPADRGMSIPFDSKADEAIPATFDLMEYMTPIRSQGRRGTCTIFATVALMESLYVREGTLMNPDFSEQFLQWSTKNEVMAFQNTAGSNPSYNLQSINRHGIVLEDLWPYEDGQWGTSQDEACTGDSQPTRCYTNGEPPAEALAAQRFTLPRGRWINPSARSLQGHMLSTRTGVVVSGAFFYQAWSHGRSGLTTSSDYKRHGYVLSPNAEDREDSSGDRRAGHGFLLLGWDDNLAVPRLDAMGQPEVDAEGEPVMEVGFFLFKNSWGTGSFGVENPHGAGYGWISYRYVEEELTAYVAGLPDVTVPEICNDGRDNDGNGAADCADAACASERECMDPGDNYTNSTALSIPDNDPAGASNTITIAEGGTISSLAITVDVTHSYTGDLQLRLVREDASEALFFDRQGGSADDIAQTFTISDFNGTDAAGVWTLRATDLANGDTGTVNSWTLDITRCDTDCTGTPMAQTYEDVADVAIPDEGMGSVTRTINVPTGGAIEALSVSFEITHAFPLDLTVRLSQAGGREVVLVTEDSSGGTTLNRTMDVPAFIGDDAAGDWTLTVVDGAGGDTGTLHRWSMQVTTR